MIPPPMKSPLKRHPANPILTARDVPYPATLIFNAGVCKFEGRYACVFRNDFGRWGDTKFDGTNLGLAFSNDGVKWKVEAKPCMDVDKARAMLQPLIPFRDAHKEIKRVYDPRLTVLDGRVYMCFAVDTLHGLCGGIAVTEDFEHFEAITLTEPDNRNMVLFPDKVGGDYVRLDRPMPVYSHGKDRFDTWISRSPDLVHWGQSRCIVGVEDLVYANDKIGPGAPPIKTKHGWLTTLHAVDRDDSRGKNGWEKKWAKRYHAGLALLDLHDPSKVIAVAGEPLLTPEAPYETGEGATPETDGFRNHVIFPGGMVLEDDGMVKVYYGSADTTECLATAHVDELVAFCLANK
ncbi:MAG: glycosidase [Phycisphaera sp.]|nr:glycosidase [Phycisphaera sp.]